MTDFQRLEEMVAKLRAKQRNPGEGRSLAGANATARLTALVTEINETILPRRLMFQWGDVDGIQLAVANRRLQGVLAPSVPALGPFAGKPLADKDALPVGGLREALLAVLEDVPSVRITSRHLGKDDLGSDAGIAAEALMRLWGLAGDEADRSAVEDALPAFLDAVRAASIAWLSVEGEEIADQGGDAGEIAKLGDTAAYLLDAYLNRKDAIFGADDLPKAYAVANADKGVFFGDTGAQTVFVTARPGDLVRIAAAWRASFG